MITGATFQAYEQTGIDTYKVRVRLVTNDERGTYDTWMLVKGATTTELRDDASRQIADLNDRRTTRDALAGIAVGTVIPVTRPASTPPTQAEIDRGVWLEKVRRLIRARSMGTLTGQLATDITALQTDVQTTYVAGYLTAL
jgi:hypothetical protein